MKAVAHDTSEWLMSPGLGECREMVLEPPARRCSHMGDVRAIQDW